MSRPGQYTVRNYEKYIKVSITHIIIQCRHMLDYCSPSVTESGKLCIKVKLVGLLGLPISSRIFI